MHCLDTLARLNREAEEKAREKREREAIPQGSRAVVDFQDRRGNVTATYCAVRTREGTLLIIGGAVDRGDAVRWSRGA